MLIKLTGNNHWSVKWKRRKKIERSSLKWHQRIHRNWRILEMDGALGFQSQRTSGWLPNGIWRVPLASASHQVITERQSSTWNVTSILGWLFSFGWLIFDLLTVHRLIRSNRIRIHRWRRSYVRLRSGHNVTIPADTFTRSVIFKRQTSDGPFRLHTNHGQNLGS